MTQTSILSWLNQSKIKASESKSVVNPTPTAESPSFLAATAEVKTETCKSPIDRAKDRPKSPSKRLQPSGADTTPPPPLIYHRPLPDSITLVQISDQNLLPFRDLNRVLLPASYSSTFYRDTVDIPDFSSVSWAAFDRRASTDIYPQPSPIIAAARRAGITSDRPGSTAPVCQIVAAIRCILVPTSESNTHTRILYISTLGTFAAHRSRGIAANLLSKAVESGTSFLHRQAGSESDADAVDDNHANRKNETDLKAHGRIGKVARELKPYWGVDDIYHHDPSKPAIRAVMAHVWVSNSDALDFYHRLGFVDVAVVKGYYPILSPPDAVIIRKELG